MSAALTTVLFDWDGTLCDSGGAHLRAFQKALADFGVRFTRAQYCAVYTPNWYRMYEAWGLPPPLWEAGAARWLTHYQEEEPVLMDGAAAVLRSLRDRGLRLAVVTGGNRARIEKESARLGVAAMLESLVCHEDVVEKKPHPEGIVTALRRLGAAAEACCFVGDTPDDILMGRSAGVRTIGVCSEFVEARRMQACGADLLLANIAELPERMVETCSR